MSAEAYANSAYVIKELSIKKLCPKEWDAFNKAVADLDKIGESMDEFAQNIDYGEVNRNSPVYAAYKNLQIAFRDRNGLKLHIGYRSDVDGAEEGVYWFVSDMWQLTPAGRKMRRYIEKQLWVSFS